jgi:hypothetical protein
VLQRPGDFNAAKPDAGVSIPEGEKRSRPRGVGKSLRQQSAQQKGSASHGLNAEETHERLGKTIRRHFRQS